MSRKQSRNRNSNRRDRRPKSNKGVIVAALVLGVAIILAFIAWAIWPKDSFNRSALDRYVELTSTKSILNDGASVYVDMSNGMIDAYSSEQSKKDLQAIINKLAANQAIDFYGLASGEIRPLKKTHTELYNYMLNPSSYSQKQAPIEKALKQIIERQQPALLMSDFEEYNNNIVQKAAYAKSYFIEWLNMGFNITFYKWDYVEGGKPKHMFFAVFDDNADRLNSLVGNAFANVDPNIETFVLGSREFSYPTLADYLSLKQGGNYHNSKGLDVVTAVMEKGGSEDYVSYAKPFATANGEKGQFAPLDISLGAYAEYYPIGVNWRDAIANAQRMREPGVSEEDLYTHLISNLYIDFGAQDGYTIDAVEARVFDVQNAVDYAGANDTVDTDIAMPEVNEIFIGGMEEFNTQQHKLAHLYLDFDDKFDGTFPNGIPATTLLRANIVISKATPNLAAAEAFFGWPDNPSLANSVKETLTARSSSPIGRILFTYYLKTLVE